MPITAIASIQFKPGCLEEAHAAVGKTLELTRTFEGCLGVQVLVDQGDETRWLLLESWQSTAHVAAYQQYRKTNNVKSELGPLVATAPSVANYTGVNV